MTANLQSGPTVKQRAEMAHVSERSMHMAIKVLRLRPDIGAEVAAGRMSINADQAGDGGER
jgi:hypothetical protein